MQRKVTLRTMGGSVGATIPKDIADRLHVQAKVCWTQPSLTPGIDGGTNWIPIWPPSLPPTDTDSSGTTRSPMGISASASCVVMTDGSPPRKLNRIRKLIQAHQPEIQDAWRQHCG